MKTFIAKWSSKCAECKGWITKGQEAMFTTDGDKVHVDCTDVTPGAFDLQKNETICPRCFLTACDCGGDEGGKGKP